MTIGIEIDSVERKESVLVDSLRITDRINQQANEATFTAVGYRPNVGEEIVITDGDTTIFAGVVLAIEQTINGTRPEYQVSCKDWTHYLDRRLVNERYEDTTVAAVIEDIIDTYTTGFTYANVNGTQAVNSIAFSRITVSECLERLADLTGYSWFVDTDKDIHFFPKNSDPAPFGLSANAGNHVWDSLAVTEDLSQLRNRIYVIGGEAEANERTETYVADGDQLQFPLANKYASMPAVTVDSVSQTVGVDFLDEEDDFDCFWSFQQKYIRFKDSTKPAAADDVTITGTPLFPIIVNVPSVVSIDEFGEYEFKIKDPSIRSREQAIDRAKAELKAYAATIEEGSFTTYRSGLQSGQVLTINAAGISGDFLIQSVSLRMRTPSDGEWRVKIATLRTIGIIDFLQTLLRDDEITQDEAETLLSLLIFKDTVEVTDTLTLPAAVTSPPYVYGPDDGNVGRWNFSTWS
ncbi:MAG: hypothetical protein RLO51_11180 [Thalassobaculum sp.]|uniref:hypothetical protein n=1 Tax=Thalassobaculum sp. TaxID=2022740 RepID=UPI0032EDB07C